jgi:putative ABC transport system substrate-binding protein
MRRREFIGLISSAAALPSLVHAQQTRPVRRISVLFGYAGTDSETRERLDAFDKKMRELGWVPGRNIEIDYRTTGADPVKIRREVRDAVERKPEAIVASPGQVLLAVREATSAIPIVFANVPDPVGIGAVTSLSKPDGNVTGYTSIETALAGKWLEVLSEMVPGLKRVTVIYSPVNPAWRSRLQVIETLAPQLGVQLSAAPVTNDADIESAIKALANVAGSGIILLPSIFSSDHQQIVVAMARQYRVPAAYSYTQAARIGGLVSYGINIAEQFQGAALYIDRVLKGEIPGNLPVQAPTKFELTINLGAAKGLGLMVPASLVARADQVIE